MAFDTGTRIGSYEVEATLGEGGLGVVLRAHHVDTGEQVALKVLTSARRAENPGLVDRLHREATVLEALADIPYVVQLVEAFREPDDGPDVLVLEYIEGHSLQSLLGGRPPPVLDVLEWMGHACHALHDLHQAGFVHRDLKPDNLMLTGDPELPLRIIDLNSAGPAQATTGHLTRAQGTFPYTPAYLAPECFDGVPPDPSADVYALGMTFAEVLLCKHPLDPTPTAMRTNTAWQRLHEEEPFPDLRAERPEIPPPLQKILEDCTAKDRADRIPDAVALWERLKQVWDELTSSGTPPAVVRPASDPVQAAGSTSAMLQERPEPDTPTHAGALVKGAAIAGGLLVLVALLIGGPVLYLMNERAALQRELERQDAERQRLENERSAELERQADEERIRREEAERKAREAAEKARALAELKDRQQAKADELGVSPIEAKIESERTLQKLLHAQRFGSHWLYDFGDAWGRATVEQIGDVYFFEGTNTRGRDSVTLKGVVTEVADRYVMLQGTVRVRGFDDDPPCGWSGRHRLGLAGHPHYFRAQVSCEGRHHYVDLFVDDDWMRENPE